MLMESDGELMGVHGLMQQRSDSVLEGEVMRWLEGYKRRGRPKIIEVVEKDVEKIEIT